LGSRGSGRKTFGLGVAPGLTIMTPHGMFITGFLGSQLGVEATFSLYHRFVEFQRMTFLKEPHTNVDSWDESYYANYYSKNHCEYGCPVHSYCKWGLCQCNTGDLPKTSASCSADQRESGNTFDPKAGMACTMLAHSVCSNLDINLVCNPSSLTCNCRRNMAWNPVAKECQIYLDVDCSKTTSASPVSASISTAMAAVDAEMANSAAANRTKEALESWLGTREGSLAFSLLDKIDPGKVAVDEIKEAFCRDVDNLDLKPQEAVETEDQRPNLFCDPVPSSACALVYDSSSCSGGWKLAIPEAETRFRFWSSYYKYRNDIDLVGVRAGCTFTGFTGSKFNGQSGVVRGGKASDTWVVLERSPGLVHLDENIESVNCTCS